MRVRLLRLRVSPWVERVVGRCVDDAGIDAFLQITLVLFVVLSVTTVLISFTLAMYARSYAESTLVEAMRQGAVATSTDAPLGSPYGLTEAQAAANKMKVQNFVADKIQSVTGPGKPLAAFGKVECAITTPDTWPVSVAVGTPNAPSQVLDIIRCSTTATLRVASLLGQPVTFDAPVRGVIVGEHLWQRGAR